MYLHIGEDFMVSQKDVIGIFDMDKTTISKITKNFLNQAEKEKKIKTIGNEIPKSFVVITKNGKFIIYLSPISTSTLFKRNNEIIKKLV